MCFARRHENASSLSTAKVCTWPACPGARRRPKTANPRSLPGTPPQRTPPGGPPRPLGYRVKNSEKTPKRPFLARDPPYQWLIKIAAGKRASFCVFSCFFLTQIDEDFFEKSRNFDPRPCRNGRFFAVFSVFSRFFIEKS